MNAPHGMRAYQGTLWVADIDQIVYFSYLAANEDGVDHVRLLGDHTWGFEDLYSGGDRDFNDLVVQAEFSLMSL